MEVHFLEVGKVAKGALFQEEGARFNWWSEGCELIFSLDKPTKEEIAAFGTGTFQLGLAVVDHMPFICFQVFEPSKGFGEGVGKVAIPWQEMPFHICKIDPMYLPDIDAQRANPNLRILITAVLLDYNTKVIKQLRAFTIAPNFVNNMFEVLLKTTSYYTSASYVEGVNNIYNKYPIGKIAEKSIVTCLSGS